MDISKNRIKALVMGLCVCIFIHTGCADTTRNIPEKNDDSVSNMTLDTNPENNILETDDDSTSDKLLQDIYGVWEIEKVAVISEMYAGTSLDGDFEENLVDTADYIGYELEYTSDTFRLGENVYDNPAYFLDYLTIKEYNDGGKYILPDVYGFITNEGIHVYNEDNYESLSDAQIKRYQISFDEAVKYGEYHFIPVGTQVVLLNETTMLVGAWGKILLAYKIS